MLNITEVKFLLITQITCHETCNDTLSICEIVKVISHFYIKGYQARTEFGINRISLKMTKYSPYSVARDDLLDPLQ